MTWVGVEVSVAIVVSELAVVASTCNQGNGQGQKVKVKHDRVSEEQERSGRTICSLEMCRSMPQ